MDNEKQVWVEPIEPIRHGGKRHTKGPVQVSASEAARLEEIGAARIVEDQQEARGGEVAEGTNQEPPFDLKAELSALIEGGKTLDELKALNMKDLNQLLSQPVKRAEADAAFGELAPLQLPEPASTDSANASSGEALDNGSDTANSDEAADEEKEAAGQKKVVGEEAPPSVAGQAGEASASPRTAGGPDGPAEIKQEARVSNGNEGNDQDGVSGEAGATGDGGDK